MKLRLSQIALSGAGILGLTMPACKSSQPEAKPNIVLIMADDMGYSDIGCFGSEISTPNLDWLAQQGMRFTQFYNASRSCPTRASLLTGLYQHEAGVGDMVNDLGYPSYQGYLNDHCVTLGEAMKYNGYLTLMSGKWHVGNRPETLPRKRGFDRYFGLIDGAGSYFERIAYRANQPAPRWMLEDEDYNPPDSGFYLTDAIGDHAVGFLEESRESNKPFFLYMAFTAPHWPLHALPEDIAKYRGRYMNGWDSLRTERYNRMIKMGILDESEKLSPRNENSMDWNSLSEDDKKMWDLRMAVYAAMIDRLDQNVGKVIDQLKKMGALDNTLILFLSDNGGCHEKTNGQKKFLGYYGETGSRNSFDAYEIPWANASNTPFRMFKHWVHEGGISTPFIAYFPSKIKAGTFYRQPGHITDIMPTMVEFAGGKYPAEYNGNKIQPMEGISLLPAFEGKELKREKPLFWEHEGNRAMRSGDWKLVSMYDTKAKKFGKWELYDMKNDRSELNDLSSQYPERVEQMTGEYNEWADRVGVVSREVIDSRK